MLTFTSHSIINLFFCFWNLPATFTFYQHLVAGVNFPPTQRNTTAHTYLSTHATNCNRLDHEAVKWRSPCVWPQLISCNVVFYVMPRSPRTLCSLQRLINTLNQTVSLWHPWACVCVSVWVCMCVPGFYFSQGVVYQGVRMSVLHNITQGLCISVCVMNANISH